MVYMAAARMALKGARAFKRYGIKFNRPATRRNIRLRQRPRRISARRQQTRLRLRNKRRVPNTRVTYKRKRNVYDSGDGSYHQLDQLPPVKRTFGRYTRKKDLYLTRRNIVYRFQGVKQLAATPTGTSGVYAGQFGLAYITGSGFTQYPLHVYDITQCINFNQNTTVVPRPAYVLRISDAGEINFANITGQDRTGTASQDLQLEYTQPANHPYDRSILAWVQMKLNLHGCISKPTKFEITLCQMNEQVQTSTMGGFYSGTGFIQQNFWQSLIRNVTHNLIDTTHYPEVKRSLKVWKRFTYVVQPTSTSESDPAPHCKNVNMFFRFNRRMRYDWQPTAKNIVTPNDMAANGFESVLSENNTLVDPKARIFIMIRALNSVRTPTSLDSSSTPSYDLILRMCHHITRS